MIDKTFGKPRRPWHRWTSPTGRNGRFDNRSTDGGQIGVGERGIARRPFVKLQRLCRQRGERRDDRRSAIGDRLIVSWPGHSCGLKADGGPVTGDDKALARLVLRDMSRKVRTEDRLRGRCRRPHADS